MKAKQFFTKNPKRLLSKKTKTAVKKKLVNRIPRYQMCARKPEDFMSEDTAEHWTG